MKNRNPEPAHRRTARIIFYACLVLIAGLFAAILAYYVLAWIVRNWS